MSKVIPAIGFAASQTVESYLSDLVHDGMCLQKYGPERNYLWMIRPSGTDIICLDRLSSADHDPELFDTLIGRNERYFIFGKIGTEHEYFKEIDGAHAYRSLLNCTLNLLEVA